MNTHDVIDRIFKDPNTAYRLTEFENLGKPIHEILSIYPKATTARDAGKTRYYLKSLIPFPSGNEEAQVYVEDGKTNPEEIVRQLWLYKLIHQYDYKLDEIEIEAGVQFGTEVNAKAADIIVYTDKSRETPKIIIECKKPRRKDGIEQLKSYMNAKGAPVAVWSNGSDSIILYRPYPKEFDDTLYDIPKRGQEPKDVLEKKKTILDLKRDFNFKKIIQDLEELVLADSGKDEFNEIFKLIFAKIWDEKEALENRSDKTVEFSKSIDPEITYERIERLFKKACEEWPGIFKDSEGIELARRHLQVCVGPIEGVRLMGSNLRIMDDAFEYLLPTEAKKKKGQFFTPRPVVEMCVRMLNPTRKEYVLDPSCGSGGFLLHAMDWCYPAEDNDAREKRKHNYASKYLWGIDFEMRAAKTSRALMLIAGDGHTNIFGPDVSSLDPRTWFENFSGQELMQKLRKARLTAKPIPENETLKHDEKAWEYFDELLFDVILANPPFAGEMRDRKMLSHYELARPALKRAGDSKSPKEERDVLFIERIIKMLRPGGRAAIVLPQGKFNNSSLAFIREWILKKARLLAVVGLHPNTFKPHTGTKTSVLFIQKYTPEQLTAIKKVQDEVASDCPDYSAMVASILKADTGDSDISELDIPEVIAEAIDEFFGGQENEDESPEEESADSEANRTDDRETKCEEAETRVNGLRERLLKSKQKLISIQQDEEALAIQQKTELEAIAQQYKADQRKLMEMKKKAQQDHKETLKNSKEKAKPLIKKIKAEIKALEKELPQAERELKLLTNRGKLELLLEDDDLIRVLAERWIAQEVAKRLDYPIFMAVSERGGKDNSGDYVFQLSEEGHLIEDESGQPRIDQDLVNYDLLAHQLASIQEVPENQMKIAEAFVRFAQEQKLDFWRAE